MSLCIAGLEKLLDDRGRLEGAAAAGDLGSDRTARSLRMQRQLLDIAAAQAAEIEAASAELTRLQQRCFPSLPAAAGAGSGIGAGGSSSVAASMASAAAAGVSLAAAGSGLGPSAAAAAAGGGRAVGGGVVASGGGAFAPAGSRGRMRARLPAAAAVVGPDGKLPAAAAAAGAGGPGRAPGAARVVNAAGPGKAV